MFFDQLMAFYKGSDVYIWYGAVADLNNDKWTFQKLSSASLPEMDKWVQKVLKDISLNSVALKTKAVAETVPYKTPNTYSKSDLSKIFYAAIKMDENKVHLLVRKTKLEIKKWIIKNVGNEKNDASIARQLAKL